MNYFMSFVSALIGGGLIGFIQFLISRHDKKHDRIAELEKKFDEKFENLNKKIDSISSKQTKQEMDQCRTQLLLLISDYPKEYAEIMKVAEHYFSPVEKGGLGGDWYLTNLFNRFLTEQNLGKPEWFNQHD